MNHEGVRVLAVRNKAAWYTYAFEQYAVSGTDWPYLFIDLRQGKNSWSVPCSLDEAEAVVAGDPDEEEFDKRMLALTIPKKSRST